MVFLFHVCPATDTLKNKKICFSSFAFDMIHKRLKGFFSSNLYNWVILQIFNFQSSYTKMSQNWNTHYTNWRFFFVQMCHPTPEKTHFSFLFRKMSPGGIRTQDPDHESRMYIRSRPFGYGPVFTVSQKVDTVIPLILSWNLKL